jgi:hypothetical protein
VTPWGPRNGYFLGRSVTDFRGARPKVTIISHSGHVSKTIKLIGIGVELIGYGMILLYQLTVARGIGESRGMHVKPPKRAGD